MNDYFKLESLCLEKSFSRVKFETKMRNISNKSKKVAKVLKNLSLIGDIFLGNSMK